MYNISEKFWLQFLCFSAYFMYFTHTFSLFWDASTVLCRSACHQIITWYISWYVWKIRQIYNMSEKFWLQLLCIIVYFKYVKHVFGLLRNGTTLLCQSAGRHIDLLCLKFISFFKLSWSKYRTVMFICFTYRLVSICSVEMQFFQALMSTIHEL